jgi:pimeloyl-ACP methyl ester carboxylesterase
LEILIYSSLVVFALYAYFYLSYGKYTELSFETFYCKTEDGWKLPIYYFKNLPLEKIKKPPIILLHGIGANHRMMNLSKDHSLALYLSERGFDVYSCTFRGSTPSFHPNPKDHSASIGTISEKDIPSIIEAVKNHSKSSKVYWVGHSMGALSAMIHLSRSQRTDVVGFVSLGGPNFFPHKPRKSPHWLTFVSSLPLKKIAKVFFFTGGIPGPWERWFYDPESTSPKILKKLLFHGTENISMNLSRDIKSWVKTTQIMSIPGLEWNQVLHQFKIPSYWIAGEEDRVSPPWSLECGMSSLGSKRKDFESLPALGHACLILSDRARYNVYPRVYEFLRNLKS